MKRSLWPTWTPVCTALVAALLLAGCPKRPSPATATAPPPAATTPETAGATGAAPGGAAGEATTPTPGTEAAPGTVGMGPATGALPGPAPAGAAPGVGAGAAPAAPGPGPAAGPGVAAATGTAIPALPSPKEFVEIAALKDIFFDFDRYEIRPGDAKILEENARWLKSNANALLLIEGHADERGTNEYNLALGERRAKATRDYLVQLGIDAGRITVISYGEERPVCTERTEACWARNRRAHFLVKQ